MGKRNRKHDKARPATGIRNAATTDNHLQNEVESLLEARARIIKLLVRIRHLKNLSDHALEGRIFLPNLAPDAPANRRRFSAYVEQQRQVLKLTHKTVDLWMTSFGLRPEESWLRMLFDEMMAKGVTSDAGKNTLCETKPLSVPFSIKIGCRLRP